MEEIINLTRTYLLIVEKWERVFKNGQINNVSKYVFKQWLYSGKDICLMNLCNPSHNINTHGDLAM